MIVPFNTPPHTVLGHFEPHTLGLAWHRAPTGFSGALVWRGDLSGAPRVALKAWPPGVAPERIRQVHAWMQRAEQLPFVPLVYAGIGGGTVCAEGGRAWDCCRWQPGEPRANPAAAEVGLACEAIARLHDAWECESRRGPCPGVLNRLRILAENESLLAAGPGALPAVSPQLDPLLRRALAAAARLAPAATSALRRWAEHEFNLQSCLRDLRADHVLFDGPRIGGVIDFGAATVDHPAVDLARLLGDWASTDDAHFATGLGAYRRVRGAFDASDEFVRLLAQSGAVCSVLGWLVRRAVRREPAIDPAATAARLSELAARAERISHI